MSRKTTTASITKLPDNVMNTSVSSKDSLYYICLNVKKRLEAVTQLQPYLNLAYSSSELLSERQSLLLSQRQQQLLNSVSTATTPTTTRISTLSTMSNNSLLKETNFDFNMDGSNFSNSTLTNGAAATNNNNSTAPTTSSNNSLINFNMEDTMLTFSMGILPIFMDCDPVTQLSQLFQQGSPLCIIFNLVKPQFKLPVVSSDDLKICKKSIFDFILGCKKHFAFNDEELFTISDVFANSTNQLIKVLEVVITIMDSAPSIFPTTQSIQKIIDKELSNLKFNDKFSEYMKIINEFVQTERKYVNDLEILNQYKNQLLNANIITSEELYMLFPNLSDAIDFQRRFLISLEINALVEPTKQRIGALFMHSKWFFKLYEPWSIGQNAAIEFLTTTLETLNANNNKMKFIIKNKLELQSFLYKPVQRLCRYPLLLKELNSCPLDDSSSSSLNGNNLNNNNSINSSSNNNDNKLKELDIALDISKNIARSINENQRRTENHQIVKKLYGRVVNWKGYRIAKFGELLYYDNVFISINNSNDQEREFEVYLFEKIIILFQQLSQKKSTSSLILKKKSTSSTLNITSNGNSNSNSNIGIDNLNSSSSSSISMSNEPKLDLRGRIMIMNLNQILPISNRSLSISWESIKEQGNFILKFKNEEIRDNWCSCLQSLVRNMKSESYKSNASENSFISSSSMNHHLGNNTNFMDTPLKGTNHDSMASYNSGNANKHISDILPKNRFSNMENDSRNVTDNYKHSIPHDSILIRISFNSDSYTIMVELTMKMNKLKDLIMKKINGNVSKIKYQDEDGDYVILASEDDWLVAKDMLNENNEKILNIWVYP